MKEINWVDAYSSGEIGLLKAYLLANNHPPLKYIHKFTDRSIDLKKFNPEILKEYYPDAIIQYIQLVIDKENKDVVEVDEDPDDSVFVHGKWYSMDITIYDNNVFYIIDSHSITILYYDQDPIALYEKLISVLPFTKYEPKSKEIDLVAFTQGDYYTVTSEVNTIDLNIKESYNDDFVPVYEDIVNFLNRRESGLIILRGDVGTGKTSLIKHLIITNPKHYIFITNQIAEHLGSPEFVSFLLENKDSVFILEDCEKILRKRTDNNFFGSGIENILNMSDGLLSDIFNIKFICTFNADMNMIDEALLRKGRCFANYEFKSLDAIKAKKLLEKRGFSINNPKPMTLAEIYNFDNKDYSNEPRRKIGF